MNKSCCWLKKPTIFLSVLLLSGCSMFDSIELFGTDEPDYINEASIQSLEIEPVSLPSTKLPAASLNQAKDSYLSLMNNTESEALIAESLQRLAEIESMIAENMLDQGNPEAMQSHLKLAAGYYQQLLDQHIDKITPTRIRYQLARVLELGGELNLSQNLLGEISELKGNEFEVIEAGFRMAESAYSRKNYSAALSLYNRVLEHKNEPAAGQLNSFYNTALFKRGWTQFKKQKYHLAVQDFVALLHIIYQKPELRSSAEDSLIKETYRVTSLSLSYQQGASTLSNYFAKHGHAEFEAELYLSLADLYTQQQRYQDTANTYFTFVKSNPLSVEAPEFDHKGIDVLSKSGFVELVLGAKENFVENYQTGADYWLQTGIERSAKVSNWLFKNLDDVINFHHAQAQQTKNKTDYLTAAKWYRIFLKSFADHQKASDKRWLLAEALNDAGDLASSISEYQTLAFEQNNLTAIRKEEAGFRIILGRQKQFQQQEKTNKSGSESISLARQQLIKAGLAYHSAFKGSKRTPEVIAQTIELQLADGQTMAAVELARVLSQTKWTTKEQRVRAREVIANGEFDLKNYQLAEAAFTLIFKLDQHDKDKLELFHKRRAQAIYKQGEMAKQKQQYAEAIEHFLRLATVEPKSDVRIKAEFDAATLLLQIESYPRAISVLEKFARNFPGDTLTKSIPAKLIIAYEALSDWKGAAKQYEIVAASTDNIELARTASWQAATSWMKLSDQSSKNTSVALWKKYIKAYPQPFDLSLEARNNLIDLYTEQKVKWKQDFWRRKIILTVDNNKLEDVRARSLAAQSQLSLSTDSFYAFKKVKLTQPLRKSLKLKHNKLKAALAGFSKTLDYRIQPVSTQAGHRIGQLYAMLAQSILDSERPGKMTDLELEEYEILLEERAFPFEDQAIEALEANISLTQSGVWDQWIQQSFQELEILMPARYKKPEVIDDYAATP